MIQPHRLTSVPAYQQCLDRARLRETLSKQPVAALQRALAELDKQLAQQFWADADITELVSARAWYVEQLLLLLWSEYFETDVHLCLVAVGGFGRGELHPCSDIDLLFLMPQGACGDSRLNRQIEQYVTVLWDAGFYLGHAVRTVDESVTAVAEDVAIATSLMESRLLAGMGEAYQQLMATVAEQNLWPADQFFAAKYAEQQKRHALFHDTAFNLEPNIKEGPGGLRDIQMVSWVAKRHFGASTLHGLVSHGFLLESEYRDLLEGQTYLWRIRYALHLLSGRAEDRLLFDYQRDMAQRFGFKDQHSEALAVEQLMQEYYRTVMRLERLNEQLLQLFQEQLLLPQSSTQPEVVNDHFQLRNQFIEERNAAVFKRQPAALMELFVILAGRPEIRGVRAKTVRLLRQSLPSLDAGFWQKPVHCSLFLQLLDQPSGIYTQLQRMNRYGVLGTLLPEFAAITGRMQYDLFHVYTVDQHTLFVIRNIRRFAYGKYAAEFPHANAVFQRADRPALLYLAALFHDIAKGRGGDHSQLGAVDAERFCSRLDLEPKDRRLVVWLVRHHLLMSNTAQRKDIKDPAVITAFAREVGDRRHLDYLYLLTMADIAGTSPKLWNHYKNSLLWELYNSTHQALLQGLENPVDRELRIRETRSAVYSELVRQDYQQAQIDALWQRLPERVFLRFSPDQLEWMSAAVLQSEMNFLPLVKIRQSEHARLNEVFIHAPDFTGLVAAVTSVFEAIGLSVMAAKIITTNSSTGAAYSFDLFVVGDQFGQMLNQSDSDRLQHRLIQALEQRQMITVKRKTPRRLRHFTQTAIIEFADKPTEGHTLMLLECLDRPGLLSAVTEAIAACSILLHDAKIGTFGDHVEDVFVLTDSRQQCLTADMQSELKQAIQERLR